MENVIKCSHCNKDIDLSNGILFCPYCGNSLKQELGLLTCCPKCGKSSTNGQLYCGFCGSSLRNSRHMIMNSGLGFTLDICGNEITLLRYDGAKDSSFKELRDRNKINVLNEIYEHQTLTIDYIPTNVKK